MSETGVYGRHEEDMEDDDMYVPRLSVFYGECVKDDISYDQWKYEVNCMSNGDYYSEQQILYAVRQSCRGESSNILRRRGVKATLKEVLMTFDAIYGAIDTEEEILSQLYACEYIGLYI